MLFNLFLCFLVSAFVAGICGAVEIMGPMEDLETSFHQTGLGRHNDRSNC